MAQSWIAPEGVESDVLGQSKTFYPVSLKALTQTSKIAKPLLKALANLFGGVGQEISGKRVQKALKGADTAGTEHVEEFQAIDVGLATLKIKERDRAIDELVEGLSDEKNALSLLKVVMDSMREDFKRPVTEAAAKDMLETIDVRAFRDMLLGLASANVEVLGPLGVRLVEAMKGRQTGDQPVASVEPAETPSPQTTPT